MGLAEFIRKNREAILSEWEEFAGTRFPAAADMTVRQLRDHAGELLDAAADDLETEQSGQEQKKKSRGEGTARRMREVARTHAIGRMQAGFRLDQVLAEYRALRASVIRLTVHNFGPTIPETSLRKIFDPMVRSSAGEDYAGQSRSLGLGLFIVQQIVSAHGGSVAVDSKDEAGTTFTVCLPGGR